MADLMIDSGARRLFLDDFRVRYLTGRKLHMDRKILTLRGLSDRLFRSQKFLSGLLESEQARVTHWSAYLKVGLEREVIDKQDLRLYKAAVKNSCAKLKHRLDYLVIVVGALSVYGLTSLNVKSEAVPLLYFPMPFVIFILFMIFILIIERVRMIAVNAESEEILNIIDAVL